MSCALNLNSIFIGPIILILEDHDEEDVDLHQRLKSSELRPNQGNQSFFAATAAELKKLQNTSKGKKIRRFK